MKDSISENAFYHTVYELRRLVIKWEEKLIDLPDESLLERRNRQGRNIKQIIGHMIDSASNNHQRIVRLQYTPRLVFPDYTESNDMWISLQAYDQEDWKEMLQLWKFYNFHIAHIVRHTDKTKLHQVWTARNQDPVSLKDIILNYMAHFMLHIHEIEALLARSPLQEARA